MCEQSVGGLKVEITSFSQNWHTDPAFNSTAGGLGDSDAALICLPLALARISTMFLVMRGMKGG